MKALLLGFAVLSAPTPAAETLGWPPLPFDVRFEEALESAVINGVPVRVRRFRSSHPPQEVLMKIESAWRTPSGPPPRRLRQGSWDIVSVWGASQISNAQVRAGARGGTEGLLSVWSSAPQVLAEESVQGLLPDGARVLRILQSGDAQRVSRSVVATVDADPDTVRTRTADRLLERGFRPLLPVGSNQGGASASAALFRDASRELLFTVLPMGTQTGLVMHLRSEGP